MQRVADHVIFPAGPAEAAALGEVHVKAWRETYPGLLPQGYLAAMRPEAHARRWRMQLTRAKEGEVVLAAEGARGLVGYCAGAVLNAQGRLADSEVFTLYLVKSAQGGGLGRRLLGAAARVLAAQGAGSLMLWVLNGNRAAQGFYAHLGGRPVAERAVGGWGGGLTETAYRWGDAAALGRSRQ